MMSRRVAVKIIFADPGKMNDVRLIVSKTQFECDLWLLQNMISLDFKGGTSLPRSQPDVPAK